MPNDVQPTQARDYAVQIDGFCLKSRFLFFLFIFMALTVMTTGCSFIQETARTVWGSSTRALEKARVDAVSGTFACSVEECFQRVTALSRSAVKQEGKGAQTGLFDLFLSDPVRGVIVVMGVPGQVDTTEVGIFFQEMDARTTRVEVSSLSSRAKRTVARRVFADLANQFHQP